MSISPRHLQEALEHLDDSFHMEVERLSRLPQTEQVQWQQGPDPYGLDWAWLVPQADKDQSTLRRLAVIRMAFGRGSGRR